MPNATKELFRIAYRWMFGENPKEGEYDTAYIREVIDGYNRQFEKAFYED